MMFIEQHSKRNDNYTKYTLSVGDTFEAGAIVHMRARLAHLQDESVIDDDGLFLHQDAIKVSDWSKPKQIAIKKSNQSNQSNKSNESNESNESNDTHPRRPAELVVDG